jgi:hypothetical protein
MAKASLPSSFRRDSQHPGELSIGVYLWIVLSSYAYSWALELKRSAVEAAKTTAASPHVW